MTTPDPGREELDVLAEVLHWPTCTITVGHAETTDIYRTTEGS